MKMVVFDIDDTISYETNFLRKNAPEFILKKLGTNVEIKNINGYSLDEIYNVKEIYMEQGLSEEEAILKGKQLHNQFWNKNFIKYNMTKCRPGVKDLIDDFRKKGYEVHLVSLRGRKTTANENTLYQKLRQEVIKLITKNYLRINGIKYDKLKIVSSKEEKIEYINGYNPEYLFDDQYDVLEKSKNKGTKFCILNHHNENIEMNEDIVKTNDYKEIEVKEIEPKKEGSIKNLKVNNVYANKLFTETSQKLAKGMFKYYFINHYKPIIIGQENIPKKDGLVFIGNHRNKLDPILISIYAKRSIHWAALLRMFQGKEDIFSTTKGNFKCKASADFITAMGALPIARPTDENYMEINNKTINELTELLKLNSSIGLFPEGTLNRKPEETNILPLKSNRVFRMAQETDRLIQPVSITWIPKELNVKNRAIIVYSNPINTYNRNKKEIKDIWSESLNLNIDKSNEFIKKISEVPENKKKKENVKKLVKEFKQSFQKSKCK